MGAYERLTNYLERQLSNRVEVPFEDIEDEDKIGVKLPMAAKEYRAWWANEVDPKTRHYQCRAWTQVGWKVESVDISREIVVFARR